MVVRRSTLFSIPFGLCMAVGPFMGTSLSGQIHRSPPPEGAKTHTVTPGERYAADGLKRWFFGAGFRDIWSNPVPVRVLDLDNDAGGLTVTETGGYGQTFTLEFLGADGLEYAVRSLDKDPTRRLDPVLKGTIVADVIQDQTSSFLPTAGLVVDPLLDAAGLLYPRHELVVVPNDPRLGEYRSDYAGLIGMFTDRPQEGPDNTPGFAGSTRVSGTDTFLEELEEADCDRPDAREYLKARLVDILIGDRDRHEGQWRWARYPAAKAGCHTWRPIPVDRDQAFIKPDGVLMSLYRLVDYRMVEFGPSYPNLQGLTFNGWELDRQLLAPFDRSVWIEVAEELKAELTDAVIDEAVARLPEPHQERVGSWLTASLRTRRDALTDEALDYYELISGAAEITATDRDEVAIFEHLPGGGLTVTMAFAVPEGAEPHFRRTFDPEVTDEVRLFLHGGDDHVEVRGEAGDIRVRAVGGGGDDTFVNRSRATKSRTRFYDARGDNRFEGRATIDESSFDRPPSTNLVHRHALDWGGINRSVPLITYSPDVGAQFGFVHSMDRYGFRKVPWASRNTLQGAVTTVGPEVVVAWDGRFRKVLGQADVVTHVEYSGLNILRFYGFGNDTDFRAAGQDWELPGGFEEDGDEFFQVHQRELTVAPSIEFALGHRAGEEQDAVAQLQPRMRVGFGAILKYADSPPDENDDRYIGLLQPAPLGFGSYGQAGLQGWLEFDGRDNTGYPTLGFHARAGGSFFPAIWDVSETFGEVNAMVAGFVTPGEGTHKPTLAVRAGGKAVFGTYPFHEAAYLGGRHDLRGFREQRFAGKQAVFANAEIRLPLIDFRLVFPAEFGILGATDTGRVFFGGDPDEATQWHTAAGGGVWVSLLDRIQTLSLSFMSGDGLTALYLKAGMHF